MSLYRSPVAIVTGAASGIGLAVTKELLSKGWCVMMADMNTERGYELAAELSFGGMAWFFMCDVSRWESLAELFRQTWQRWFRLDAFIGNAGIDDKEDMYGPTGMLENPDIPQKPNLKTIEVNYHGILYGVRLAMHYFRMNDDPGGKIVLTSSDAGIYPMEGAPQYCSSKHAIVGLTRSMGNILARENITINAVLPAFVPTALAPPGLIEAWPKEHITPMETVVKAFTLFLEGDMSGKTGECSLDQVYMREPLPYPNESQRWGHEDAKSIWGLVYPS